jgi:hypothetical protein
LLAFCLFRDIGDATRRCKVVVGCNVVVERTADRDIDGDRTRGPKDEKVHYRRQDAATTPASRSRRAGRNHSLRLGFILIVGKVV